MHSFSTAHTKTAPAHALIPSLLRPHVRQRLSAAAALAAPLLFASLALAQTPPAPAQAPGASWPEVKCARYKAAWTELVARRGTAGLGAEFLGRHEAFLAGGCTAQPDVCPRSEAELEVANIMVLLSFNGGMGSTFAPFACRRQPAS